MRSRRTGRVAAGPIVLLLLSAGLLLLAGAGPARATGPRLNAKAWVLTDFRSGETLASGRPHARLPMASTTKLMTAWLALHRLPSGRRVRAVDYHGDPSESLMGLEPGQRVSVRDLLYGLVMLSGNDAAETLAVATSGSVPAFVREMNRAAGRMGLADTHYENPVGLDSERHYTSAADLAVLGRRLMEIPRFRRIAGSREATLTSLSPPERIETANGFLLAYPWARGIKTGHTLASGFSLVSDGRRKATELVAATIGSPTVTARDRESARLLGYGFGLYRKNLPVRPGHTVIRIPVRYSGDRTLGLVPSRKVRIGVRDDQKLEVKVDAPDEVEGPIRRGERLGRARVLLDGERIAAVNLLAGRSVEAPTWFDRIKAGPVLPLAGLVLSVCVILAATVYARRRRAARTRKKLRRAVRMRS